MTPILPAVAPAGPDGGGSVRGGEARTGPPLRPRRTGPTWLPVRPIPLARTVRVVSTLIPGVTRDHEPAPCRSTLCVICGPWREHLAALEQRLAVHEQRTGSHT